MPHERVKRVASKRVNYVADFETTTDPLDCRVWGWGLADIERPEDVEIDTTIDYFIERVSVENSNCYFHNLKFDGHFIIDWLLKNGYVHVGGEEKNATPGTFKTLISNMGKFYSMTVRWNNGSTTEFRDSLKKLPMSVERIAKSFKYETGKGEIDYDAPRPVGHKITVEESDYITRDVSIVAKAIKQTLDNGMKRLTVASDALAEYKRLVTGNRFTNMFPVLSDEMDSEIRRAYRGGFTYADDRYKGRRTRSGHVLDVNSLYPAVMAQRMLPYGEPEFVDGVVLPTEKRPLTIFSVTFTAKLKPEHIPCIQIKSSSMFAPTEYLREVSEPTTLMMTNVDFALYSEHYDIHVLEYGGGWRFYAAEGLFHEYISKWSRIKEHSTGGIKEIAKLHLNSLYGKFASNPNVTSKYPTLTDDGAVKYLRGIDETRPPVYTAMGVFITSYARDLTIRAAQENYGTFAYADTDSLHLLRDDVPANIEVHPTRMGAWKYEYSFESAFYIRPKAYLEKHAQWCKCSDGNCDGGYTNRIAGLPERVSGPLTFDDIQNNRVFHGKLAPKSVPGGLILADVPFQLKL